MAFFDKYIPNSSQFLMGNEAIAIGALEAGVNFAAGYTGTPSSEIIETLSTAAKQIKLHVEWSTNEKVATEAAAAAAFSGLRSIAAMKNAGLSVALDFLTHLSLTGLGSGGGAFIVVVCDDPDAHSSGDETDSRWLAKFACAPLVEPTTVQEAKELVKWAFELSRKFQCYVMIRSYTRLSHASSTVEIHDVPSVPLNADLDNSQSISPYLARPKHAELLKKLVDIRQDFESSPYNRYEGPNDPDLIIISSGSGVSCSMEAIELLDLQNSVGILKLVTLWPFPRKLVTNYLSKVDKVLIVEEVDPFLEVHVKETVVDSHQGSITIFGKESGHIPGYGEITPDRVIRALSRIYDLRYEPRSKAYAETLSETAENLLISRGLTWCAGCPHRASFWALERAIKAEGGNAFVTGDIGCYTLDIFPEGRGRMNLLHAMGSGTGLAAGLGQLYQFNCTKPVISICGDSTFYHASIPALINAVYNRSNVIQIILDNAATAMTGFQSHPGTGFNAEGDPTPRIDIEKICNSLGCQVAVSDPFDIKGTIKKIRKFMKAREGVRVLILRRTCELLRMRKEKTVPFTVHIEQENCKGEKCGICSSAFRCPAFILDPANGKAHIIAEICSGCGVCVDICPFNAIIREENT